MTSLKYSRALLGRALVLALVGSSLVSTAAHAEGMPPSDQVFGSLEEAVEYGAVDPLLAKQIMAGKTVSVIAQLEPSKVVDAYGIGDEESVAKVSALIKGMRTEVLKEIPVKASLLFEFVPAFVADLSNAELALKLINQKHVLALMPDRPNKLHLDESLPRIGQPEFVSGGLTGVGTAVVVLDTGADYTAGDFGLCTAPGVPASCRVPVAVEAAPNDNSVDDNGHGTNVSAVVAGVAPGTQVIPIDVFDGKTIWDRHAISGLSWALGNRYRYNIAAVNMSFGFDQYFTTVCGGPSFQNAYTGPFQMLRQAGVLPVASTGNHAMDTGSFRRGIAAPACTDGAVAVGATYTRDETDDQTFRSCTDRGPILADQITCFSTGGPLVDVLAPGTGVTAASITMDGTSQASPHVAGAVAILKQAAPNSSAYERQTQVTTSGVQITDPRTGLTHPRLDLRSAVKAAVPVSNDDRANKTVLIGSSGRFAQTTWTASAEPGEPLHAGDPGGASVWYEWTPTYNMSAVISTEGSDFDTLLSVYAVDANNNLTLLKGNDDEGMGLLTSEVSFNATGGQKIQIAVDGKLDRATNFPGTGHIKLTWNLPNDDIGDAVSFPGTINIVGTVRSGSNLRSTHQWGEPPHCGDRYATASVWYKWTPTFDQTVRVRLGAAQVSCLAIYSAPKTVPTPGFSQLTRIVSISDDQGDPLDTVLDGEMANTYWIAVDGVSFESACYPNGMCDYATSAGPFNLQFN